MSLPNDVARCYGRDAETGKTCRMRFGCRRHTEIETGRSFSNLMNEYNPEVCEYHIPTSKEGQP